VDPPAVARQVARRHPRCHPVVHRGPRAAAHTAVGHHPGLAADAVPAHSSPSWTLALSSLV
jgi:hypothetical protein